MLLKSGSVKCNQPISELIKVRYQSLISQTCSKTVLILASKACYQRISRRLKFAQDVDIIYDPEN